MVRPSVPSYYGLGGVRLSIASGPLETGRLRWGSWKGTSCATTSNTGNKMAHQGLSCAFMASNSARSFKSKIDIAFCGTMNGLGMLSVGIENRDDGIVLRDGGQDLCRILRAFSYFASAAAARAVM